MTLCHVANLSSLTDNDYDNNYADTQGSPTPQTCMHACMHACNRMEHTSTGAHGHRHIHAQTLACTQTLCDIISDNYRDACLMHCIFIKIITVIVMVIQRY